MKKLGSFHFQHSLIALDKLQRFFAIIIYQDIKTQPSISNLNPSARRVRHPLSRQPSS